jgi:hypothetical protein
MLPATYESALRPAALVRESDAPDADPTAYESESDLPRSVVDGTVPGKCTHRSELTHTLY